MKIAILCAMEREAQEILNHFNFVDTLDVGGLTIHAGKFRGHTVYMTVSGLGKVFAASAAQLLISRFTPAVALNIGLAGGCDETLTAGSVVVAEKTVMHDFDYALGERLAGCPTPSAPDDELVRISYAVTKKLELPVRCGTVASGDVFVESDALKRSIVERTGCSCVDMEGAAFAAVCERNGVRCGVIKVISDSAGDDAFENFSISVNRYCYLSQQIILGIIGRL